jgi:hypothetical protein
MAAYKPLTTLAMLFLFVGPSNPALANTPGRTVSGIRSAHASHATTQQATVEHSIPFTLTKHNNITIKALLNERDQVNLMFHLAAGSVSLTRQATRRLNSVKFDSDASVTSWGGQKQPVRYSSSNTLQIWQQRWTTLAITEDKHSGHETDGKFGPHLFAGKVFELNFDTKKLLVHSELPKTTQQYTRFEIKLKNGTMFIASRTQVGDSLIPHSFMIHTGFGGAVLFDDKFAAAQQLGKRLQVVGGRELKDSMGNIIKTSRVIVPSMVFGEFELQNVPAEIFPGAMGRQKLSVVGADILKRFNIIFDIGNGQIFMKPNSLFESKFS